MKIIILISILLIGIPCFAQDKVYTNDDLSNIKNPDNTEYELTQKELIKQRRKALAQQGIEVEISDRPLYEKCRLHRQIDDEFDYLISGDETDRDARIAHASLKYKHRQMCGNLY